MTEYIRFVEDQRDWIEWRLDWLNDDDVPSDRLTERRIKDNCLSIYKYENDDQKTRILAAYGAMRNKAGNLDYICIMDNLLLDAGLEIDDTEPGITKDEEVNKLHSNIVHLSGKKLVQFVSLLLHEGIPDREFEKQLLLQINSNIKKGFLPKKGLSGEVKSRLAFYGLDDVLK
ncbi:MAG: hypothetical protein JEZ00_21455 [Anaerolineaceae bacterium]|nr:hypothetical protein [Anaerolineaceae bacterium]